MPEINTYPMKSNTILRLNAIKDEVDLSPEYQRRSEIWNLDKRQLLIDSILNDYDIPKIYFHHFLGPKKLPGGRTVTYAVIDGRQRIETIIQFINDKFTIASDFEYYKDPKVKAGGLTYSELAKRYPQLKVYFDSFGLPIILVEADDQDIIEDMFSRLNEAVPLNAAEKRNAFGGPMPKIISRIARHAFFRKKVKVPDTRYQHREVAVRMLFLEYSLANNTLIDTKKVFLDGFVKQFKNTKSDPRPIAAKVSDVLDAMTRIFQDKDDLLRAQGTLPIYYLLVRSAMKQKKLSVIKREKLSKFRDKVDANRELAEHDIRKANFDLLNYDRLSIQGTNDASSIRERLRVICKYFKLDPEYS